jgi:NADH-quinone oxidoreductase subunit L
MWIPLAILAILSLIGGWAFNIPKFLAPMFPLVEEAPGTEWTMYVSIAAGLLGIALAYLFYVVSPALPESLASTFSGPYRWLYNKYFVDELYDSVVISPTVDGSRSFLWRVVDAGGIDRIVNGVGKIARSIGGFLRRPQSGSIRSYADWVVLGSILLIAFAGFAGGSK